MGAGRALPVPPVHILATINWSSLAEAALGSLVAGVGIVLAFSVGLWGLVRASALRSDERKLGAAMAAAVGAFGLLVAIAGITFGLLMVAEGGLLG